MTIVVSGATGTVGEQVTRQLAAGGHAVRALTRNPGAARLPAGVEVAGGDLTRPDTVTDALRGASALHLISVDGADYSALETGEEIVARAVDAGIGRIIVLTGTDDELAVFEAVRSSGVAWTHIRPSVEFMANKREWAPSIRDEGVVRAVYGGFASALVHEADVAAVAVAALTEDGHAGVTYAPTGPQVLSRTETARRIGDGIGRELEFVELTRQQMRAEMVDEYGIDPATADYVLDHEAESPAAGLTVTDDVERATGTPPRSFATWVAEHVDLFTS